MLLDRMIGGILFLSCLSVCLTVCLSVVNFNLCYNFWTIRDRDFIFGMHTPLITPFQTRHYLTGQIPPASTTPVSWTTIKSSPSHLTLKSYGPDTDFGYVCTVTLTLELWPWVKAWHTLESWTRNVWNIIQIKHMAVKSYGRTLILCISALWPWPWRYDLGQGHDTPLGHGQQLCEILSRSNMAVKSYGPDTHRL